MESAEELWSRVIKEYELWISEVEAGTRIPTLDEYIYFDGVDDNLCYRLSSGHIRNFLDEAIERLEE